MVTCLGRPQKATCEISAVEITFLTMGSFTLTLKVLLEEQPLLVASAVKIVVSILRLSLLSIPLIGLPVPLVVIPVMFTPLSLVQEKVVPTSPLGLVMLTGVIAAPEQIF